MPAAAFVRALLMIRSLGVAFRLAVFFLLAFFLVAFFREVFAMMSFALPLGLCVVFGIALGISEP